MVCASNESQSRSIAAGGLLLWSAKVTKALIGKRLLYAHGHAAQRSEQHIPIAIGTGYFAPLTLAQSSPSAKSPMPLSRAQGHHCSARFWLKLFANEKRNKSQETGMKLSTEQKNPQYPNNCGILIFGQHNIGPITPLQRKLSSHEFSFWYFFFCGKRKSTSTDDE